MIEIISKIYNMIWITLVLVDSGFIKLANKWVGFKLNQSQLWDQLKLLLAIITNYAKMFSDSKLWIPKSTLLSPVMEVSAIKVNKLLKIIFKY